MFKLRQLFHKRNRKTFGNLSVFIMWAIRLVLHIAKFSDMIVYDYAE